MPLVYLPDRSAFFLWGDERSARGLNGLASEGQPAVAAIVAPGKRAEVEGIALPLFETMARLAVVPAADVPALPGSIATWTLASKLALDLVGRERVVPTIVARWRRVAGALGAPPCRPPRMRRRSPRSLAACRPRRTPCRRRDGGAREVWAPEALLRAFLDAVVDALVRAARGAPELPAPKRGEDARHDDDYTPWEQRWRVGLCRRRDAASRPTGFAERSVVEDLERWSEPALGAPRPAARVLSARAAGGRSRSFHAALPAPVAGRPEPARYRRGGVEAPRVAASRSSAARSAIRRSRCSKRSVARRGCSRRSRESLAEARPEALTLDPASGVDVPGRRRRRRSPRPASASSSRPS